MEVILKAAVICVLGAVFASLIKKSNQEMAVLLSLSLCCVTVYISLGAARDILALMNEAASLAGMGQETLKLVIKAVFAAIVTKISSSVCRDAGQSAAASAVETAGAAASLCISIPLIEKVIKMISGFV
jgi:stage III sporulation protein AD